MLVERCVLTEIKIIIIIIITYMYHACESKNAPFYFCNDFAKPRFFDLASNT